MTEETRSAEVDKMMAMIFKVGAETAKIQAQTRWCTTVAAVAMFGLCCSVVLLVGL